MSRIDYPQGADRLKVAVLMGGASSEREVSLVSGRMIADALDRTLFDVVTIDTHELLSLPAGIGGDLSRSIEPMSGSASDQEIASSVMTVPRTIPRKLQPVERPDVVFIALHGKGGEDGTVQGMLELMGLPYTGSGVLASALAMDKVMSKRLFIAAGIPVIEGFYITKQRLDACGDLGSGQEPLGQVESTVGFPVFVKPNAGGSTCGCTLVETASDLMPAVRTALKFDDVALVERYVSGIEITVGVLDTAGEPLLALPVIEIVPKAAYYDYESKYAEGGSEHIIPARIPEALLERSQEIAKECHRLLGCRGMSRTDLLVEDDKLYVLEVNTIPGMTPTSLLPQAAEHAGIPFPQLLERLIRSAMASK